jgi:hypothetical protein
MQRARKTQLKFLDMAGRSERSFRNRLVVREITLQIHWLGLTRLILAKRVVRQGGELVLSAGECFGPTSLGTKFGEEKLGKSVLL